jgi:hypothetical protein
MDFFILYNENENMDTIVVNKHTSTYDVYIGRGSKRGNPFVIGTHGDRAGVIAMYEKYIRSNPALLESLHELVGKTL